MDTRTSVATALSALLFGMVTGCGGGGGDDAPTRIAPLENELASPAPDPVDPRPVDPGPIEPGPIEPDPTDSGPIALDPIDPDTTDPGPTASDPTDPGPVDPDPIVPESDVSGDDTGIVPSVIDRMGRPGITTALVRTDGDENAYNANGDPATWAATFTAPVLERVRLVDTLDGVTGNALLDAETLTGLLVDDRLQIDTSIPECDAYLALEIGLGGCGGRTLERDVIDDTLRYLVAQDMPVGDLADGNDVALPGDWPFLAEPFPSRPN